jgi:hypothetical protein
VCKNIKGVAKIDISKAKIKHFCCYYGQTQFNRFWNCGSVPEAHSIKQNQVLEIS